MADRITHTGKRAEPTGKPIMGLDMEKSRPQGSRKDPACLK